MSRASMPDNRVNRFHPGQVWKTSRGGLWRVERIENGQAVFRQGFDGQGRIKRKDWDDVLNWVLYYDPEYDDEIPKEQKEGQGDE